MTVDRKLIFACLVAFVVGSWASSSGDSSGPFGPRPRPLDERPILKWIAKAARTLLWVSLMAEGPPAEEPVDAAHLAQHRGEQLDFGRGW